MKNKVYLIISLLFIFLIISCKKINLLSPSIIPPPTEFPVSEEMPDYIVPSPIPPENIEESYIEINPEIVADSTVFGGYGRRFKFQNEWYVLATNEYQYNHNTKTLNPTGKGAVLRIEKDGSTITKIHSLSSGSDLEKAKIHSLSSGSDLEKAEYWKNLNSKKLVITDTEVNIPIKAESQGWATNWEYKIPDDVPNNISDFNIYKKITYDNFGYIEKLIIHYSNRSSSDLLNWNKSSSSNVFDFPKPNFNNPNFQGRFGNAGRNEIVYFKGKIFVFRTFFYIYDKYLTYYIEPNDGYFIMGTNEYYTIEWGKDMSDAKNWVTNHIGNALYYNFSEMWYDENKLYVQPLEYKKYTYSEKWKLWTNYFGYNGAVYTTEDGINWKKESYDIIKEYKPTLSGVSAGFDPIINYGQGGIVNETNEMLGFEMQDGTPFEPSYIELNGKYYRTFNSTYPMPPIKEIMETVDRFETNFTVTEEHIKKSGYYQLQVSSVSPDKAQESDWVNVVPNNQLTSSIGWESGGADLFTFNNKIVRLVDYDRQFKLNTQYETALNLAEKYYNLLLNSTMSDFKKYDYYFLYYKAMADMLKIIKDKGSDYFRPDEAVTHYTFEIN